jgi:hypothetical protein
VSLGMAVGVKLASGRKRGKTSTPGTLAGHQSSRSPPKK